MTDTAPFTAAYVVSAVGFAVTFIVLPFACDLLSRFHRRGVARLRAHRHQRREYDSGGRWSA